MNYAPCASRLQLYRKRGCCAYDFLIYFTIGDYAAPDTGYNYIYDPSNGVYGVGASFDLALVETQGEKRPASSISWFLDDEPVSGSQITFGPSGKHLIEAKFTTADGSRAVVELEVRVQ